MELHVFLDVRYANHDVISTSGMQLNGWRDLYFGPIYKIILPIINYITLYLSNTNIGALFIMEILQYLYVSSFNLI